MKKIIIYKIDWRFEEFGEEIYRKEYFSERKAAEVEYNEIKNILPKGATIVMYKQVIGEDNNFKLTKEGEEVLHYNYI